MALTELVKEQTAQIKSQSTQPRPKGLGKLTDQLIGRELCDPKRFQNRRQVSSYLGLCPGEHSSGARQQRGHITKTGNPRLRWALTTGACAVWPAGMVSTIFRRAMSKMHTLLSGAAQVTKM